MVATSPGLKRREDCGRLLQGPGRTRKHSAQPLGAGPWKNPRGALAKSPWAPCFSLVATSLVRKAVAAFACAFESSAYLASKSLTMPASANFARPPVFASASQPAGEVMPRVLVNAPNVAPSSSSRQRSTASKFEQTSIVSAFIWSSSIPRQGSSARAFCHASLLPPCGGVRERVKPPLPERSAIGARRSSRDVLFRKQAATIAFASSLSVQPFH